MRTAGYRLMLVCLIPAFVLGAFMAALYLALRMAAQEWHELWQEASWQPILRGRHIHP
jgi:hypothetical protein